MKAILVTILLMLLSMILSEDSLAAIYKYVDKNGTTCFTDDLHNVPEEYRSSIISLIEQPKTEKNKSSEKDIQVFKERAMPAPLIEDEEKQGVIEKIIQIANRLSNNDTLITSISLAAIFLIVFIFSGRLSELIGIKRLGSVIRIVLVCTLLYYLLTANLKSVTDTFESVKKQALDIKKDIKGKSDKTDKALKDLEVYKKAVEELTEK